MRVPFRSIVLGSLLASGLVAAIAARADYLEGATGYTTMRDNATGELVPGIINFAVLDRSRAAFGDSWATGLPYFNRRFVPGVDPMGRTSPALDTAARYVYLYQVANDGTRDAFRHAAVTIAVPLRYITSWGYFRAAGFGDDDAMAGVIVPVSARNVFGVRDRTAAPGAPVLNVYYPRALDIATGRDVGLNPDEVLLTATSLRASWVETPGMLAPGAHGVIFGFTSDLPPQLLPGTIIRRPEEREADAVDALSGVTATPAVDGAQ